ncbi:MAG: GHKL domain-containing protein [Deltaproteobacteria bacterium]|nr:GHKL domain-containing protein [Deltaproteobacteria bacterium]
MTGQPDKDIKSASSRQRLSDSRAKSANSTTYFKTKKTNNHGFGEIRLRLLIAMIVAPAIPFCLVLSVGYYHFYDSLKNETIEKMEVIVSSHKKSIEEFLHERTTDLRMIVDSFDYDYLCQPSNLAKVNANLVKSETGFMDIGVFNAGGVHVAYIGPYQLTGIDYSDQVWFKEVMQKKLYISDVFLGFRRSPHFIVAVAKTTEDKPWILRSTVDTSLFQQTVENVRIRQTGEAYIVNKDGFFQTRRRSGGELMEKDPDSGRYLPYVQATPYFLDLESSGERFLYVTTALKNNDWILVVRQKRDDAFEQLNQAAKIILIVSVVGTLLIVGVAIYVTNHIINRLRELDADKTQLGKQLIATERLAQIGEMSAGVAHEINNPLQIIEMERTLIEVNLHEMIDRNELKSSDDLDQILDSINEIKVELQRTAEITQGLLKFARKKDHITQLVNLSGLIPDIIGLVRRKASVEGISFKENISLDVPLVELDPAQFQQVLLNLLNNAIDAVISKSGSSGGEIKLWLKALNNEVAIGVSDNGCGISLENQEKIFTPFFTTKPVGQGTGLGLAVCYGIIHQMKGHIQVDSVEGQGTTFTIFLPIAKPDPRPASSGKSDERIAS